MRVLGVGVYVVKISVSQLLASADVKINVKVLLIDNLILKLILPTFRLDAPIPS